jgi:Late embryogenesis abundant protein
MALPTHAPVQFISRPVPESIKKRLLKQLCSFFLSVLFVAAFILFLLWLALRPHRPRFHISSFSTSPFPPPESSSPSFSVEIVIRNPNRKIEYFFGPIQGSVHYRGDLIGTNTDMGGPLFQPPKNTTIVGARLKGGLITALDSAGMQNDLSENAYVELKFILKTTLRFRLSAWETHGARVIHVSCNVAVGSDGQIMAESKSRRCSLYLF